MATHDVIVRPDGWEISATGKLTKSTNALADALRWGQSSGAQVFSVEGAHPAGLALCESASKKTSVIPGTYSPVLWPIILVGADPLASIGPVSFWQKTGRPGPFSASDITIKPTSKTRYCIQVAKQATFPELEIALRRVRLESAWPETVLNNIATVGRAARRAVLSWLVGDGPPAQGADWGINGHGAIAGYLLEDVTGDGFQEHLAYIHNVMRYFIARRCIGTDCGRTMIQVVNREWELIDKKTGALSEWTEVESTPETASCVIEDCLAVDCSSYPDSKAKGGWQPNGSAITIAGFPGTVSIAHNRVMHTHPGGGGICVFGDAKVGAYKTTDGYSHGDVTISDNRLHTLAGAAAGREAVMVGDSRSLTMLRNENTGTERRVKLNHTGKIGVLNYDGSLA